VEYSNGNTMTRKEYLKSKKKSNFWLSKLKYVLLIIVVILLGIYVFKQLNVYNNVTKLANKVVEETKLARTMTMYYVSEPYTKDGNKSIMLYKSYDESRTKIDGSENFSNIKVIENKLYGVCDNNLYAIDLLTNSKIEISDKKVQDYVVQNTAIYLKLDDGIYKHVIESGQTKKIIDGKCFEFTIEGNNVYAITAGKTSKSIVKYNLNGKKEKELSDKFIVTGMIIKDDNIYFINSKDSNLYMVSKAGGKIQKVVDEKIAKVENVVCYKDRIYYINKDDNNTLYMYNLKTKETRIVVKKNIESIQINGDIIYYTISSNIGINKFDITTGKTSQITSVRTTEYICLN